ncbi:MAG: DUF4349 domain-containing protein [Ferruginibacter sp.]
MRNYLLLAGLLCFFLSCNTIHDDNKEIIVQSDTASNAFTSSSAAVEKNKDSIRKFIRTADIKFKVKSVINSTYDIENICTSHGGFVTYTNLASTIENQSEIPFSADSTLETINYTITNSIILRVPNTKLDTTLKDVAKNIDYLDYRIIKADDVSLQMLANKLTHNRAVKNEIRLAKDIDNTTKKLSETMTAEELLFNKQEQADNAKISNLSMADQVSFSTVNLLIYRRQTVKRTVIANDKNITAYQPGFWNRLWDAIQFGWSMILEFFLFVSKLWAFFLGGLLVFWLYKSYKRTSA